MKKLYGEFNNTELIENLDYFLKLDSMLTCSICLGFLIDPKECKTCQSNFCNVCLTIWKKECPNKCSNKEFNKAHKATINMLENLVIRCYRCSNSIEYSKYMEHIEKFCDNLKVKCSNLGCQKEVEKINLHNHINKECEFTFNNCEECGSYVQKRNFKNKLAEVKSEYEDLKKKMLNLSRENIKLKNGSNDNNNLDQLKNDNYCEIDSAECSYCHRSSYSIIWRWKDNCSGWGISENINLCCRKCVTKGVNFTSRFGECPLNHSFEMKSREIDKIICIVCNKFPDSKKNKDFKIFYDPKCKISVCSECFTFKSNKSGWGN
jgi:hypothetical protein